MPACRRRSLRVAMMPGATRWSCFIALACSSSVERNWEKPGGTPTALQADESECLATAGPARRPPLSAETAGNPGREGDFTGRGHEGYVTCMQGKGYTRPGR
jgi:hypothetical protein